MNEEEIPAMNEIDAWFRSLSRGLRVALFGDPGRLMAGDQLAEVLHSGKQVGAAAWFTSVEDGPAGFPLPEDVVDYIAQERDNLDDWWSGLSDAARDEWRALGDGPLSEALRSPYPDLYLLPIPDGGDQNADPVLIDYVEAWQWRTAAKFGYTKL